MYLSHICFPKFELTLIRKTLQVIERVFSSLLTAGLAIVQAIHLSEYIYIKNGSSVVKSALNSSMVSNLLDFVDVKVSNTVMIMMDVTILATNHLYPSCLPITKLIIIDNSTGTITKEF